MFSAKKLKSRRNASTKWSPEPSTASPVPLQFYSVLLPVPSVRSARFLTVSASDLTSSVRASAKSIPPPTATTSSSRRSVTIRDPRCCEDFCCLALVRPANVRVFLANSYRRLRIQRPVQTLVTETPQVIQNQSDCIQREPRTGARAPLSTYRLQLHAGFPFADAEAVLSYLRDLGIGDCYASPIFEARPGSMHGYDVTRHDRLNPELGGEEGFARFAARLRGLGMG